MSQFLMFWLIPLIILVIMGISINVYRVYFGSKKDMPKEVKIYSFIPTPWCVIFSLIPLANIVMVFSLSILLLNRKDREFLL